MFKSVSCALALAVLAAVPAHAKTVFTDLSDFLVGLPAAGQVFTETFETGYTDGETFTGSANMTLSPGPGFTAADFTIETGAGSINGSNPLESFALELPDQDNGTVATLSFTAPLAYFGFYYIDAGSPVIDGSDFGNTAASGDSALFGGFHFTAADNKTSIVIANVDGDGLWGLDGLVWGTLPSTSPIPVPAALPLLLGGLGLLAMARRRA
jgi:hypothetical protein